MCVCSCRSRVQSNHEERQYRSIYLWLFIIVFDFPMQICDFLLVQYILKLLTFTSQSHYFFLFKGWWQRNLSECRTIILYVQDVTLRNSSYCCMTISCSAILFCEGFYDFDIFLCFSKEQNMVMTSLPTGRIKKNILQLS